MSEKTTFAKLGLQKSILKALSELGYQTPSPIQSACIPYLLNGKDILGTAQTGSGKTAAFSLPLLQNIKTEICSPQILVLVPTRELAIQVKEAWNNFSKYMHVHAIAIYGGQQYGIQFKAISRGPQIIVGTPGRLLDHLKRKTLNLSNLNSVVLDEADEMLRMGFIEDVESILSLLPVRRQTALFSATMPEEIRKIGKRFMYRPKEIEIISSISDRPDINQTYWLVRGIQKNEALIRFLELENFDAAIIFVRTKHSTIELSERLERIGYNSAALNGDMNQSRREQTLYQLRKKELDILVATDVASRGLDVDRVDLVVNYDIPTDPESYIHRIGRTGRAGRTGKSLLFVENHQRYLLRNIRNSTKSNISKINLPSIKELNDRRFASFSSKIQNQSKDIDLDIYRELFRKLQKNSQIDLETLSAVLLKMAQGERFLFLSDSKKIYPNFQQEKRKYKTKEYIYRIEVGKKDRIKIENMNDLVEEIKKIFNFHHINNIDISQFYTIIRTSKKLSRSIIFHLTQMNILRKKKIKIQFVTETTSSKEK